MKKYLRLTLNERAQHLNLFINFTILVITGFALKYPEAFWVSPITDVPAGMTIRGFLHRLCGVATVTLGGYHVLYCIFTEERQRDHQRYDPWVERCHRPLGDIEEQLLHQSASQRAQNESIQFQ